jgi:hypothetical protein
MSEQDKFIYFLLLQFGSPYGWGKENPESSDCSGAVCLALYAATGLLIRTTAAAHDSRSNRLVYPGGVMKRLTPEEKYLYSLRKQREALVSFAVDEELNSELLLTYYKQKGRDMPDDIYRACAFFINREYKRKPGSLYLLYQTKEKLQKDITVVTKENAVDILCYRYQMYAAILREGGY